MLVLNIISQICPISLISQIGVQRYCFFLNCAIPLRNIFRENGSTGRKTAFWAFYKIPIGGRYATPNALNQRFFSVSAPMLSYLLLRSLFPKKSGSFSNGLRTNSLRSSFEADRPELCGGKNGLRNISHTPPHSLYPIFYPKLHFFTIFLA